MGRFDGNSNGALWYSLSVSQQRAVQRSPVDPGERSLDYRVYRTLGPKGTSHGRNIHYVSDYWKLFFLISAVKNVLNVQVNIVI